MTGQKIKDPRVVAVSAVKAVIQNKRSLSQVLPEVLSDANQDAGLIHELTAGTLRWWWQLVLQVDKFLNKPLKTKDFDIYCLIVIGLYQIQFMRIPDHAAVSQTVNSTKILGKRWSGNLVNAVLRQCIREQETLIQSFKNDPIFNYSHPHWMIETMQQDWPDQWQKMLQANNHPNALTLRVNSRKSSVEKTMNQLQDQNINCSATLDSPVGIRINDKSKIWNNELWTQGSISVQDESAQLVAYALELKPGMQVLDACAAPGGKTCHFLELEPELKLLALEKDAARMTRLRENLQRSNLECNTQVADAADLDSWWKGDLFDIILLDAPCSGSGVIHKHPDIKHLRRETDIAQTILNQRQLLDKLWSVLKTGGSLLYCTCSVFRQENDQQAQWFIDKYSNAQQIPLDNRFGQQMDIGRQRLPSQYDADGFYYAGFSKNPI